MSSLFDINHDKDDDDDEKRHLWNFNFGDLGSIIKPPNRSSFVVLWQASFRFVSPPNVEILEKEGPMIPVDVRMINDDKSRLFSRSVSFLLFSSQTLNVQ